MSPTSELVESIRPLRERLLNHPLYASIAGPESLRTFMEHHVFAVWDFMTLLKSLQRSLSCVEVPWLPSRDRQARRLVNEIVLAEESDADGRGGFASHFELYLDAMRQAGADLAPIESFLSALQTGEPIDAALAGPTVPPAARAFVRTTWGFVESGSVAAVAAAFTLGREELIPGLFRGMIASIDLRGEGRFASLLSYMDRHVQLDGDEHGPMALRMLSATCGDDPSSWRDARFAATTALEARLALWDAVHAKVEGAAVGP